ncbi:unnamed protein product [Sphagnum balticum]
MVTKEDTVSSSDSDTGVDGREHGDVVSSPVKQVDYEDEFEEEQSGCAKRTPDAIVTLVLQQPSPCDVPPIPTLRQVAQIKDDDFDRSTTERLDLSSHEEMDTRNPVGPAVEDDDFCDEVQDVGNAQTDTHLEEGRLLSVETGTEMEWFGMRRKDRESVQHHTCCFGINHPVYLGDHHLYMVDVVPEDDQHQELIPHEAEDRKESGTVQSNTDRLVLRRKRPHYYDKQQQLEMVLTAQ